MVLPEVDLQERIFGREHPVIFQLTALQRDIYLLRINFWWVFNIILCYQQTLIFSFLTQIWVNFSPFFINFVLFLYNNLPFCDLKLTFLAISQLYSVQTISKLILRNIHFITLNKMPDFILSELIFDFFIGWKLFFII